MAKLVALYKMPADKAAFDSHYFSKHIPIARKMPGLQAYEVSSSPVETPAGPSPFHLVALLTFDSLGALQQALASPEGAAAAADLANFAQAGVDLLVFDTKEV
ncbi:EthD family reductase [Cupriavidus consociatus]|uniref:EthD family reductase n=1 Tax=Cupriavidus consociatus TaxID=2821357 RepID=UPI001AE4BB7C|nr:MULTISPECIES: EthD family reductase [unclassified Cupriavidus]MBP0618873.1 EthD family reductase [Cupriavidus sp. LEh25]MDK2655516.1 EthD family reductase [Cupriavidus sp. LEh21]